MLVALTDVLYLINIPPVISASLTSIFHALSYSSVSRIFVVLFKSGKIWFAIPPCYQPKLLGNVGIVDPRYHLLTTTEHTSAKQIDGRLGGQNEHGRFVLEYPD